MKKAIILILSMSLMLCGCANRGDTKDNSSQQSAESTVSESQSRDVFAMDTYMMMKAFGAGADKALDKSEEEIRRLESLFSVNIEDSDISKINANSGNSVTVDESTSELIKKAVDMSVQTDGALDISVYPVLREWGFTTGEYKIPERDVLEELLKNVDYRNISIDGNNITIPKDCAIDLGSVAKGYTSDRICEIMRENGITSALINLGGNVQAVGKKTDGSLWKVGIENPINNESNICVVEIADKAVITSGNYERYFVGEDGKNYWHIIDTKDGYPADNGLISVTVIGEKGVECDALSTALFVMGTEKAAEFCKSHRDTEMILVTKDMEIYVTDGLTDTIRMSDGYSYKTIQRD